MLDVEGRGVVDVVYAMQPPANMRRRLTQCLQCGSHRRYVQLLYLLLCSESCACAAVGGLVVDVNVLAGQCKCGIHLQFMLMYGYLRSVRNASASEGMRDFHTAASLRGM